MTTRAPRDLGALSDWAVELADAFVSLASDIALVIGPDGVIDAVARSDDEMPALGVDEWIGRPWAETVTADTRPKIRKLLDEVRQTGRARRREINHPIEGDELMPVAYTAVELGRGGPVLAVGRDLRAVAVIQQRFLEAQRDLERGYWQAKQLDARYRLLFEAATDGALLVNAGDLRILECNEAAARLFEVPVEDVIGELASFVVDGPSRPALSSLLRATQTGEPREVTARFLCRGRRVSISVNPLRVDGAPMLMLRLRPAEADFDGEALNAAISRLVYDSTDCVVVTDASGSVVVTNRAFLGLLKLDANDAVAGHPIADWLSVDSSTWAEFRDDVRRRGVVRDKEARIMLQTAEVATVTMTATLLVEGDQERIGFTFELPPSPPNAGDELRRSLEAVAARVGEAKLADLLEHAEGAVERFLALRALQVCDGDRARAARMLGIEAARLEAALAGPESPA